MCADPIARSYWRAVVDAVREYDEIVAWASVPQCVRCGGCVEPFNENCHYYENLMRDISLSDQMDVMKRYDIYNEKIKKIVLNNIKK